MPPTVLKDVDIQLIGVVLYEGKATAFIRDRAEGTERFYEVGQMLRDYRVTAVKSESVELERRNVKYLLYLSAPPGLHPPPRLRDAQSQASSSSSDSSRPASQSSEAPSVRDSRTFRLKSESRFIIPMVGKVTSGFGYRTHPMGGGRKFHNGIDIAAPHGTPVKAADAGKVIFAGNKWSLGDAVIIQHTSGYQTLYGHLSKILVKKGEQVKQDQVIGREGSTGISTGPHLHFSILYRGKYVDPARYLPPIEKE
jgi:murein DD-endopeptidase MepM/ murein hydrolase activator NlpD